MRLWFSLQPSSAKWRGWITRRWACWPCTVRLCAIGVLLALARGPSVWAADPTNSAAQCPASPLGSPCGAGAALVQAGPTDPAGSIGAGNPIHLGSGNRHWVEHDGDGQHPLHDLLQRHYNSQDVRHGLLAAKWAFAFEVRLHRWGSGWQIIQADGSRRLFAAAQTAEAAPLQGRELALDATPSRDAERTTQVGLSGRTLHRADGRTCAGLEAHTGVLHFEHAPSAEGRQPASSWVWPDGQVLSFDANGDLSRWEQAGQLPVIFERGAAQAQTPAPNRTGATPRSGQIQRIRQGDVQLHLVWSLPSATHPARLLEIRSSLGRVWYFEHDWIGERWRLLQVRAAGSARRILYSHDPNAEPNQAHLITQRAVQRAPRAQLEVTHQQHYDAQNRVVESAYGNGQEQLRQLQIVYPGASESPELRRIRHAAGELQVQVAQRDGRWQILKQEGALCEGCIDLATGRVFDAPSHWAAALPGDLRRSVAHRWPATGLTASTSAATASPLSPTTPARSDMVATSSASSADLSLKHGLLAAAQADPPTRLRRSQLGGFPLIELEHPLAQTGWSIDNGSLSIREQRAAHSDPRGLSIPAYRLDQRWVRAASHKVHELLPEGGQLEWSFDPQGRLLGLTWQASAGPSIALNTHTTATLPSSWRRLDSAGRLIAAPGKQLGLSDWWFWDSHGRLALARVGGKTLRPPKIWDAQGRALVHRGWQLEYGPQGRLSQATHGDGRQVQWLRDGLGRVIRRIENQAGQPPLIEDYHYLGAHLQAVLRPDSAGRMQVWRRIIRAGAFPVAMIEYGMQQPRLFHVQSDASGLPVALRDANGRLVFEAHYGGFGQLLSEVRAHDLEPLPWRYPGQWADPATGWHENHGRVMDPELGEYLQRDPVGPHRLTHPYAYAAHQPWRFADPWGSLLIAFDGTGQDNRGLTQTNVLHMANLYGRGQGQTADAVADQTLYVTGLGTDSLAPVNIANQLFALSATQALDDTWERLLRLLSGHDGKTVIPIDIVGFSRGAALGRIFANRIQDHMLAQGRFHVADHRDQVLVDTCLQLRFMGLFDTVAQFGLPGEANDPHDLSIHPDWQRVAHAVAMHEDRALFPLQSLYGAYHLDQIVERGFLGNHADIGGGYHIPAGTLPAPDPEPQVIYMPGSDPPPLPDPPFNPLHWTGGDLSNVSLQWMMRQAQSTGLQWFSMPESLQSVSIPVFHRANGWLDDRVDEFKGVGHGRTVYNYHGEYVHPEFIEIIGNSWTSLSATQRAEQLEFVTPIEETGACCDAFGWVDMTAYESWLDTHLKHWRMP